MILACRRREFTVWNCVERFRHGERVTGFVPRAFQTEQDCYRVVVRVSDGAVGRAAADTGVAPHGVLYRRLAASAARAANGRAWIPTVRLQKRKLVEHALTLAMCRVGRASRRMRRTPFACVFRCIVTRERCRASCGFPPAFACSFRQCITHHKTNFIATR
jgi:hypothetical protein